MSIERYLLEWIQSVSLRAPSIISLNWNRERERERTVTLSVFKFPIVQYERVWVCRNVFILCLFNLNSCGYCVCAVLFVLCVCARSCSHHSRSVCTYLRNARFIAVIVRYRKRTCFTVAQADAAHLSTSFIRLFENEGDS